jgi:hypothetical protein
VISSREEYGMHILSTALPKDAMQVDGANVHGAQASPYLLLFLVNSIALANAA